MIDNRSRQLAQTPPMGWNSWNAFSCGVTESDIRAAADMLINIGLGEADYKHIVVDNCWIHTDLNGDKPLAAVADFPTEAT